MIYITGDTHGEQNRILYIEKKTGIKKGDHLIVCGDFGYIFFNNLTENNFLNDLEKRPYTIAFCDGNHENFDAINSYPTETWNGGKVHRIRKNVVHLMRGQVFEIDGKKFFTMGGAYSIDKYRREENISWWKDELPSDEEYKEASISLEKNGKFTYIPREFKECFEYDVLVFDLSGEALFLKEADFEELIKRLENCSGAQHLLRSVLRSSRYVDSSICDVESAVWEHFTREETEDFSGSLGVKASFDEYGRLKLEPVDTIK